MQWLTHNGERCGVEGDFAIDADGNLVSVTENLIGLGLVPGQAIMFRDDGHTAIASHISEAGIVRLLHNGGQRSAGPVDSFFIGRLTSHIGDKEI